jgi:hypothetical protein
LCVIVPSSNTSVSIYELAMASFYVLIVSNHFYSSNDRSKIIKCVVCKDKHIGGCSGVHCPAKTVVSSISLSAKKTGG